MFNNTIFGIIYLIKHKTCDDKKVYVGSTINLKQRINQHRKNCNNKKNKNYKNKLYQYLRENGGFNQYEFIILECYVYNFKRELLCKEDDYIKMYDNNLNQLRAYLSDEEHKNRHKKYREENKDKLKEKNKKQNKKKYEKYAEKYKEEARKYREENKDKLKEKITCECGSIVRKADITKHCKTKKHIQYIEKK